jgi:carbamoyl-phosphate synthase large subunit
LSEIISDRNLHFQSGKNLVRILMTGGGAPGAPGILQCLRQEPSFQITVGDANAEATGRWLHPDFVQIPFAHEENFIDTMLAVCRQKNIQVILPLVTKELLPLALHKKEFEAAGIHVILSPAAAIELANNKCRLYEFLQKNGMTVPLFRTVKNPDEFKQAAAALNYPEKDICFKPAISNGSRGFRIVTEKINELDLLLNQKPQSLYITFEHALRILSADKFPELLVSDYLPGPEYSVDCLVNQGKTVLCVPRSRRKIIHGISAEGEFINDEDISSYCTRISALLQLHGNIGFQLKKSESGEPLLLEINPRLQGTVCAALGAGVNLPVLAIKQELGFAITEKELQVKWGTRFSRYWNEVFY